MMDPVSLAVNWYIPKDPEDRERLRYVADELRDLAPWWVGLIRACTADGPGLTNLWRDSSNQGGTRTIPYVKDLVELAKAQDHRQSIWWGTINTDTLVTPKFFQRLLEVPREANLIVVRVWDIPEIPAAGRPFEPRRRRIPVSIDGVLVNAYSYRLWQETFPDYIFAEEWDRGLVAWIRRYREIRPFLIDNGEALHITHGRPWLSDQKDIAASYNLERLKEFMKR